MSIQTPLKPSLQTQIEAAFKNAKDNGSVDGASSDTIIKTLAKEIADALASGAVKPDIYTKTLAWYTELIEWEKRMKDLAPDGNIL